ncbi:MAG TPA: dihydrofolate reductase family protein, partial [Gaiellaceae bacterium]|nr:dihydrofolate reductase family protein [Gaiellaceae bacterium]
ALGERGITSLLVEGGGTVAAEALRARAVDRVVLFLAPRLLGGDGIPAIGALGLPRVADAVEIVDVSLGRIGPDLVLEGRIRHRSR